MVKRNLIANFAGALWSTALSLLLVPFYLRRIGIEAYGLVAFFVSLQGLLAMLDLGIGSTFNRELARFGHAAENGEASGIAAALQRLYWLASLIIGALVFLAARYLSTSWFNAHHLSSEAIEQSVMLMALIAAAQFPFAFYGNGLLGMQRHVAYAAAVILGATARAVGAIVVLSWISATSQALFAALLAGTVAQTAFSAWSFWRAVPPKKERVALMPLLRSYWRFAAGMTGINVCAALLTQMDKIVLSRTLPLTQFGIYSLAAGLASGLSLLAMPFFTTMFPRLARLVVEADDARLISAYHRACQTLAVVVVPAALILICFARDLIRAWTGDAAIAAQAAPIVAFIAAGFALNALVSVPYALQLAYGWTRLTLIANIVAVAILVPVTIVVSVRYGGVGAAVVWLVLNACYVIIYAQIMYSRLLPREKWSWYLHDLAVPAAAALCVAWPVSAFLPATMTRPLIVVLVGATAALTMAAAALATREPRAMLLALLRKAA